MNCISQSPDSASSICSDLVKKRAARERDREVSRISQGQVLISESMANYYLSRSEYSKLTRVTARDLWQTTCSKILLEQMVSPTVLPAEHNDALSHAVPFL
jgi:hypothetical protein